VWLLPQLLYATVAVDAPLPVDPAVHIGTLDNGVTYWIRSHATPPGKISFWMHVATGSLNEQDGQEGLAHYLEHLAFNGTQHFPPGELVNYFESIGLRFGQHQNAFTSFDQTTYTLTLPNTHPETIDKGLLFLSDVAFGMLLLPEEIDKERNVILEEKRARKGVRQRLTEQLLPALLPGSRLAQRLPIGLESTITRVQRDDFLAYYATWYHPTKITILAVGDAPVETIEAAITSHFAAWQQAGPATPAVGDEVKPYQTSGAIVLTDPELTTATVEMLALRPLQPEKTARDVRQHLIESLGTWIVNRRLEQLIQEGKAPYQRADISIASFLGVIEQISAEAESDARTWRETLTSLIAEVERARQYGFTTQELTDAKTAILAAAEYEQQTEPTRDARELLSDMNQSLSSDELPRTADQNVRLLRQLLPAIGTDEVATTFAARFTPSPKAYVVLLPAQADLTVPSQDDVLALVNQTLAHPVAPWQQTDRPTALLASLPQPGMIAERTYYAPIDVTHVTFANNVRVHYRFMDFKTNHVTVVITLAGGAIQETASNRGITDVAMQPLLHPATSRFSATALRDFMTGKKVSVQGGMTDDTIVLRVSGTPEALEDGLQLAHLLLLDATIEPARVGLWKRQTLQSLAAQRMRVSARASQTARLLLSGNDPRMQALTPEQIEARAQDIPQAQAWLSALLRTAPMEVAIVGDLAAERALALAATYLGSLPPRPLSDTSLAALRHTTSLSGPLEDIIDVETITPRAQPILMWRSAPWQDVRGRRLTYLASRILERRVRQQIREDRGLTYSTATYARSERIYPEMSALYVQFTTDPDKVTEAVCLARSVVETFATEGPTDAEMATLRKQIQHTMTTQLQEPHFWVNLLADMDYHGTKLEDVDSLVEKLLRYSKEEIAATIKKTIQPERFAVVIGRPKTAHAPSYDHMPSCPASSRSSNSSSSSSSSIAASELAE
jgi:zinc protease